MTVNRPGDVREQYRDSRNLGARADLHVRFSTNPYGWNRWVFDRIELPARARVLEVGCGPGFLWRSSIERVSSGWRIVATDMSSGMASEARDAVADDRFRFGVADAQALPFTDRSFDLVVANHMLYHVPDLDGALAEFSRVLRPGGVLFAATNGEGHMIEIRQAIGGSWRYIRAFGLETGPDAVGRHFDDVRVERYDDSIDATEVEPVLDYVRSMSSLGVSGDGVLEELRKRTADAINRDGAFHISKDAGLIRATRR